MNMYILGIETSCDETGIAIYSKKNGLISNKLYSQEKLHIGYGGIVPEIAARSHLNKVIPLIKNALIQSNIKYSDIYRIAYTAGPGLVGPLIVGSTIAKTLAYAWNIPSIAINHMEGHLLSPMLSNSNISIFPCVGLLISGGHTQLISATDIGKYKLLGESVDDSIGEAFDKVAKLLGLGYPGGKKLSNLAKNGIPNKYFFPRPMTNKSGLMFSFSGIKTFAANVINNSSNNYQTKADIARAFEDAIVDTLLIKCQRALDITGFHKLVVSGGVSANRRIRDNLKKFMCQRNGKVFYPNINFCTDNGAMIAYVGLIRSKINIQEDLKILVKKKWSIEDLLPIKG